MDALREKSDIFLKFSDCYGTDSEDSIYILGSQVISSLGGVEKVGKSTHSAIMDMLRAMSPQNAHEAMLAVQIVATHFLAMDSIAKVREPGSVEVIELYVKTTDKLMKLFIKQTEALRRLKHGNSQKIIIEKVEVNSGGQAVVGSVGRGG